MIDWKKRKDKIKIKNSDIYLFLKSKGNVKKFKINKKIYDSLNNFGWFDKSYYLKKYPHIKKSGF